MDSFSSVEKLGDQSANHWPTTDSMLLACGYQCQLSDSALSSVFWATATASAMAVGEISTLVRLSQMGPKSGTERELINSSWLAKKNNLSLMIGPPSAKPWVVSLNLGGSN